MDVSGWTIEQKSRLPDWCFGSQLMICRRNKIQNYATYEWTISTDVLPDPACIWCFGITVIETPDTSSRFRFGLLDNVPTTVAQMDAAVNLFPDFGNNDFAPPRIPILSSYGEGYQIRMKYGVATGGKKLAVEHYQAAGARKADIIVYLIVSALPTDMAGWMAHNK